MSQQTPGGLECLIREALEKGRITFRPGGRARNDDLQSKFNQYVAAKARYAEAVHFRTAEELQRQVKDHHPTPEEIQRAVMAQLRAIDRCCVEDGSRLDAVLPIEIARHLDAAYAWEPTHQADWAVFGRMITAIDPRTGLICKASSQALPDSEDVGPAAPDDSAAAAVYGEKAAKLRDSLSSPELRDAFRLYYEKNEEDWMMYCRTNNLNLEQFHELVQRALKELRDEA